MAVLSTFPICVLTRASWLIFGGVVRLGRTGGGCELNLPSDVQQVIGPYIAVHLLNNGWTSLVADELSDFRIGQAALARLRDKIGAQPVRRYMANTQFLARLAQ